MKCFKHLTRAGKILLLSAVVAFAASTAFAQSSSVEFMASSDIFRADADNVLSEIRWGQVEFDKAYVGARLNNDQLQAGAAVNIGGIYIAGQYYGNFVGNDWGRPNVQTEYGATHKVTVPNAHGEYLTWESVAITEKDWSLWNASNNGSVLIGIANMGISLGYDESGSTKTGTWDDFELGDGSQESNTSYTNTTDTQVDTTETIFANYKAKKYDNRSYNPCVGFGIDLGAIKPFVTVKVSIYNNGAEYYSKKETVSGVNGPTTRVVETTAKNIDNCVYIIPKLGAEIDIGENGRLSASYNPTIRIGNKNNGGVEKTVVTTDYNDILGSKTVTTSYTLDNNSGAAFSKIEKAFYMGNNLGVSYVYTNDVADRITVGAKAGVSVNFDFDNTTTRNYKYSKTTTEKDKYNSGYGVPSTNVEETTTEGALTNNNKFTLGCRPTLAGAVSIAATDKIKVVVGAATSVRLESVTKTTSQSIGDTPSTTVTHTVLTVDNEEIQNSTSTPAKTYADPTDSKTVETYFDSRYGANIGLIFAPVENFELGTNLSVGKVSNVTDIGLTIQAQVKF